MNHVRSWLTAVLVAASAAGGASAQSLPSERAKQEQQAQQQVLVMARQLVTDVLDKQLRQLRENGMQSHPWYAAIADMRKHMHDEMVTRQMPRVIELLAKVETCPEGEREKIFQEAREMSLAIVVRMLEDRQALLRRLKVAEMASQVQQLIALQTRVRDDTHGLPEQPLSRRTAMNLTAIQDQHDVRVIYGHFRASLEEVGKWSGPFGEEAVAGLKRLDQDHVDRELLAAEAGLKSDQFAGAEKSQDAVLRALKAVLEQIRRADRLDQESNAVLNEEIARLIRMQEDLRKRTLQARLDQPSSAQFIQEQSDIRKRIAVLSDAFSIRPDVRPPLDRAQQHAAAAAAKLFQRSQTEATDEQEQVVENLQEALRRGQQGDGPSLAGLSPAQLKKLIADLLAAAEDLKKAGLQQKQVVDSVQKDPPQANKQEQEVVKQLEKVPQDRDLPAALRGVWRMPARRPNRPPPKPAARSSGCKRPMPRNRPSSGPSPRPWPPGPRPNARRS